MPRRRPQARLAPIYQLDTQNMLARAATRPACRAASAGAARSFSTSGVQQANLKELGGFFVFLFNAHDIMLNGLLCSQRPVSSRMCSVALPAIRESPLTLIGPACPFLAGSLRLPISAMVLFDNTVSATSKRCAPVRNCVDMLAAGSHAGSNAASAIQVTKSMVRSASSCIHLTYC